MEGSQDSSLPVTLHGRVKRSRYKDSHSRRSCSTAPETDVATEPAALELKSPGGRTAPRAATAAAASAAATASVGAEAGSEEEEVEARSGSGPQQASLFLKYEKARVARELMRRKTWGAGGGERGRGLKLVGRGAGRERMLSHREPTAWVANEGAGNGA